MTKHVKPMRHALRLALLFAVLSCGFAAREAAAQASVPVTVINGASKPVPVTGSINATISGTPNVSATITGTPSVSISGTPAVTINNAAPLQVRDRDNPANNPFSVSLCSSIGTALSSCAVPANPGSQATDITFTIPSVLAQGSASANVQRAVIDFLSGRCTSLPNTLIIGVTLTIPAGGTPYDVVPVNVSAVPAQTEAYAFAQQTAIYANPGDVLQMGASYVPTAQTGIDYFCYMTVSGHYVLQ